MDLLVLAPTEELGHFWTHRHRFALWKLQEQGGRVRVVTSPRDLHGYTEAGLYAAASKPRVELPKGLVEHAMVCAATGCRWVQLLPDGSLQETQAPPGCAL